MYSEAFLSYTFQENPNERPQADDESDEDDMFAEPPTEVIKEVIKEEDPLAEMGENDENDENDEDDEDSEYVITVTVPEEGDTTYDEEEEEICDQQ